MTKIPQSLSLGALHIEPAVTLAPMAGVTDTVFRQFIRRLGGCGLIMTEFTSSHGVIAEEKRKVTGKKRRGHGFNYLYFEPNEHPIVAQLFGGDPKVLADAARVVEDAGFDGVDMNFGCPVKKVVKCNGGSGLLRDLPLIREILKAVRAAVSIPLSPASSARAGTTRKSSAAKSARSPRTWACKEWRCMGARASRATPVRPTGTGSQRSNKQ